MHYHVWTRTTLRHHEPRSPALPDQKRRLQAHPPALGREGGDGPASATEYLGLSPQQRELVYKQALRVAQDIVFRRGSLARCPV